MGTFVRHTEAKDGQLASATGRVSAWTLLLTINVILTIASCQPSPKKDRVGVISNETISPSMDRVLIEHAKNFTVTYKQGYKVVHIHYNSPEMGVVFDQKLVLVQKGNDPQDLNQEFEDAWVIEVPLKTIAANDDGEITRIKALGLTEHIIAMGGGAIYDAVLRRLWEEKKIASIGYSFHRPPLPEMVLSLNPDVLIQYTHNHNGLTSLEKMRALGINAVPQFAWAEPSFLGKAEWVKFTSLFFNREKEANALFTEIVLRCEQLMEKVQKIEDKVTAFLVYHPSENSDWSAHRNDFYASFLEASGAINVLADDGPTHAVGVNNEKILSLAKDADFWLVNSTSDESWPTIDYLKAFKAYRNGQVYHYQKRTRYEHNAYDWYETPEVRPDLVLEDLVSIFYPELLPNHELLYFEKVTLTKKHLE